MPSNVTYDGATKREDTSTVFIVDGERFVKGKTRELDNPDLEKELGESTSERLKGHKFTVESAKGSTAKPTPEKKG